jgi:hypothetical protein
MPVIEAAYQASLAAIPDGPAKAGGVATGEAAAAAMLTARAGDGRFGSFLFQVGFLPGQWRPTTGTAIDPGAWLKDVRPFVLRDPDLFRGRAPYDLDSPEYAADFNEVKTIGSANSPIRMLDQTAAANYWACPTRPPRWRASSAQSQMARAAAWPTTPGCLRACTRTPRTR